VDKLGSVKPAGTTILGGDSGPSIRLGIDRVNWKSDFADRFQPQAFGPLERTLPIIKANAPEAVVVRDTSDLTRSFRGLYRVQAQLQLLFAKNGEISQ